MLGTLATPNRPTKGAEGVSIVRAIPVRDKRAYPIWIPGQALPAQGAQATALHTGDVRARELRLRRGQH